MKMAAGGRLWGRVVSAAFPAVSIGLLLPDTSVAASPAAHAANAQATVGAFPLFAALGIGIAVAAGAVIAFLHVTAKGKQPKENFDQTREEPREETEEERDGFADYTIPLSAVAAMASASEQAAEGEPRLHGVAGEFQGASFRLNGEGLSIGRDPGICDVVFPGDTGEVSRRHCTLRFERDKGLFILEDHGSSNGTFLTGGQRLEPGKRYELRSGQRFAVSGGVHWFEVRE